MKLLTDLCDHEESDTCQHCEEGCEKCGRLVDLDDNCLCDDCAWNRLEYLADMVYEREKYNE